ncbi:MAG TPA: family 16 glycoside hydrolase [Anaerolineales bacterium]
MLTATDATQYAWEGDRVIGEAESSLFTHYVVQGLQSGEADINGDGQITIDELYDYVYTQVVHQTPRQTPGKWSFKEQGEIVIARAGRPEGARPIVETQPFVDVELQQKLERLYTKGLSAYWLDEWEQAAHNFQLILEINPDYQNAAEKFAEVRRQLKLKNLYDQALADFEAQKYREAATAFEALVAEAPDYKDAASKLQAARKQGQVADLYTQAKQLHQAGQWRAVIHIFGRIAELAPDYVDTEELLPTARHEFEYQKRLAETKGRYQQALQAMNSGRWQEALSSFSQIQEEEPGFEDTERLLARVEAEIAKQEAQRRVQEQVGILHEQAINLSRARQWSQALAKMREIESLDPEFADPDEIAARAEAEIAREEGEAQRQNELAALYAEAVRLLREGDYQLALEKWGEVQAINPDYLDRHEVQATARKKMNDPQKESTPGRGLSKELIIAVAIIGITIIIAVLSVIPRCEPGVWYCEDFENNRADGWELEPGWEVRLEGDNHVLSGTGHRWATLVSTGQEWKDYRVRFRLKLQQGRIHLNYRLMDPDKYFISFGEEWLQLLGRDGVLIEVDARHALNVWYDVEIRGQKGNIQVFVNGRKELDYTDLKPIPQGTIAFETLDGSRALLDDIEVLPTEP